MKEKIFRDLTFAALGVWVGFSFGEQVSTQVESLFPALNETIYDELAVMPLALFVSVIFKLGLDRAYDATFSK
jgi:hypothetical protein